MADGEASAGSPGVSIDIKFTETLNAELNAFVQCIHGARGVSVLPFVGCIVAD